MPDASPPPPTRGVIFAATGDRHVRLVQRAAESLRRIHSHLEIDLFTDSAGRDIGAPFSRVVELEDVWFRSKIDAMRLTRFEHTIYLDADVIVIADIEDVFDLLDRFDIAAAHDQEANSAHGTKIWREELPACFPQFNSGVLVYRAVPAVLDLIREWGEVVRTEEHKRDQPALRELLWQSDLRINTLPAEYNYSQIRNVLLFRAHQIAPRIIHGYDNYMLPHAGGAGEKPQFTPRALTRILTNMTRADRYLARRAGRRPENTTRLRKRLLQFQALLGLLRRS